MNVDKSEHVFCGYCGERMGEVDQPSYTYDRKTGKARKQGYVTWTCPKADISHGLDNDLHDHLFLRTYAETTD